MVPIPARSNPRSARCSHAVSAPWDHGVRMFVGRGRGGEIGFKTPSANIRNLTNHLLEYVLLVVQDHTQSMKSCCQQHQDASMPYRANCGKHFGLTRRMIKTMGLSWFPKSTGESNTFRMKLYSTSWGCSIYETHPYVLAPVCGMGLGLLLHQLPLPCAFHDSIEDCSWNHGLQTPETKLKFQTHATCKRNISNIYIYMNYNMDYHRISYYIMVDW